MTTVFIYEHLCALGASGGQSLAPSLLAEGRAMLDAVSTDFHALTDVDVLKISHEDEAEFRRLAARAAFSLIIAPESDGILEARCRWTEESGSLLLGPLSEAVHLAADKLALGQRFVTAKVPTPWTWRWGEEPDGLLPLVLKPRYGAGSQSTYLVESATGRTAAESELRSAANYPEMIAQVFVDGIAASVAFLIGPRERLALQPCFQHLSTDGRFRYLGGSLPMPPELARRAVAIGSCAIDAVSGLFGFVGVDVILGSSSSEDRVIEINPRLTTSYVGLRRLACFNIAEMMLRVARGETAAELCWHAGLVEFTPCTH